MRSEEHFSNFFLAHNDLRGRLQGARLDARISTEPVIPDAEARFFATVLAHEVIQDRLECDATRANSWTTAYRRMMANYQTPRKRLGLCQQYLRFCGQPGSVPE